MLLIGFWGIKTYSLLCSCLTISFSSRVLKTIMPGAWEERFGVDFRFFVNISNPPRLLYF